MMKDVRVAIATLALSFVAHVEERALPAQDLRPVRRPLVIVAETPAFVRRSRARVFFVVGWNVTGAVGRRPPAAQQRVPELVVPSAGVRGRVERHRPPTAAAPDHPGRCPSSAFAWTNEARFGFGDAARQFPIRQ